MAFTDFKSVAHVQEAYRIRYVEEDFLENTTVFPSPLFLGELEFNLQHIDVFTSEAARCENIIYPILREVYKPFAAEYALWSHKQISYDSTLTGIPDYLIATQSPLGKTVFGLPILVVTEAKENNFAEGWGQCLAEMVASQKINQQDTLPIYGIVTDGEVWHVGKLVHDVFTKHRTRFSIDNVEKLFGALHRLIACAGQHRTKT